MATTTTNLGLTKPDYGEAADIQVINDNMDALDTAVAAKAPASHASSATTYGVSTASAYGHAMASSTTPKANGTAAVGSETAKFARGDHVHPLQTTVSGNAGSATKLATARTIDGVSFNGTAAITHYGTCSTAAATAAKTVSVTGFTLATGAKVTVKFTVTNTASSPTLNVNSTGAKAIYYRGAAISAGYLAANRTYTFVYNGTQYELIGDINVDTNSTTTTGTTNKTGTKLYLAGATTQATAPTTYSNSGVYIGTDNKIYSNGTVVVDGAGTGLSKSGSTLALGTVTQSDTTATTETPAHGGTFTVVSGVTRDDYGRVTGITTKGVTLPGDANTDTKVTQAYSTDTSYHPVLMSATSGTSSTASRGATTAVLNNGVYAKPSTGELVAGSMVSAGGIQSNSGWIDAHTSSATASQTTEANLDRYIGFIGSDGNSIAYLHPYVGTTANALDIVVNTKSNGTYPLTLRSDKKLLLGTEAVFSNPGAAFTRASLANASEGTAQSSYCKLRFGSNTLIVQWGQYRADDDEYTLTFPTAWTNAWSYSIGVIADNSIHSSTGHFPVIDSRSATKCVISDAKYENSWIAVGF